LHDVDTVGQNQLQGFGMQNMILLLEAPFGSKGSPETLPFSPCHTQRYS